MAKVVDLNCDMGEGFGHWSYGDAADEALIEGVTSANVATGYHAGDPNIMYTVAALAAKHRGGRGAHPGYDDRQGFGRRVINARAEELVNDMLTEIASIQHTFDVPDSLLINADETGKKGSKFKEVFSKNRNVNWLSAARVFLFGARAVESMRLEKGFLHWKADILTEFDPFETGLERFVSFKKEGFIGRDALKKRQAAGPQKSRVTLKIDTDTAAAHAGASLMSKDQVVGTITSGDWGHRVGFNLAYAFMDPSCSAIGTRCTLDLCGDLVLAQVIAASPYDPAHKIMRGR